MSGCGCACHADYPGEPGCPQRARLDTATAENERLRERVEIQQDAIRGLGEIDAEKSAALDTARADALNEAADAWEESRGDTSATVYQWLRACAATTAPEDTT